MAQQLTARVGPSSAPPKAEQSRTLQPWDCSMWLELGGSRISAEPLCRPAWPCGTAGPSPASIQSFVQMKPESFSWALFIFKWDFTEACSSFLSGIDTLSIFRTSELIGSARAKGSGQGHHRELLLQLVDSLPNQKPNYTKPQQQCIKDTEDSSPL